MKQVPICVAGCLLVAGCSSSNIEPAQQDASSHDVQAPPPANDAAQPTDASTPADAGIDAGPRAMFHGCPVFQPGDTYNSRIDALPADPKSADYITSFLAVAGTAAKMVVNHAGTDPAAVVWDINLATNATPSYPVWTYRFSSAGQSVAGITDFPFLPTYNWEDKGFNGPAEHHLMVVNTDDCVDYELYATVHPEPPPSYAVDDAGRLVPVGGTGNRWDLTKPYVEETNGAVNAAGVPHFAGMVRWEDWQQGAIYHELNIDLIAHSLRGNAYVSPATSREATGYYTGPSTYAATALPLGAHLRLKSTYVLACGASCPQAQMVVTALKQYGAYVMDTGGVPAELYLASTQDAMGNWYNPWTPADVSNLDTIPLDELEVVPPAGCATLESCVK